MSMITVCRDCCCGSKSKHPDTDHDGQLSLLRAAGVNVRLADCLDVCESSNVMVVHRRRPVWLGGILDPEITKWVGEWAVEGGPMPDVLQPYVIERPRKNA